MKLTKEEILKKYLTEREKGTWNEIIEEAKFIERLLFLIGQINSPVVRSHMYNQVQPELERMKDEKNRLKITAQVRYEEDLRGKGMHNYLRK